MVNIVVWEVKLNELSVGQFKLGNKGGMILNNMVIFIERLVQ